MIETVERSLRGLLWDKVPRNHRQDPRPFLVRRVVTAVFVVIGAGVLAWSLGIDPGNSTFYVAALVLAATWTVGAFASGPIHLGRIARPDRHDDLRRPVGGAILLGLALSGVFVVGALVVRQVPVIATQVSNVLDHASAGVTPLLVVITVVNGIAEELFFRGALYAAVPRYPVAVSTVAYTIATLATGNFMLGFAAILLGLVVGLERRASGGVLAPILTHVTWSTVMLFALPLIF
ncbi:MAG: type II CAAX endopeptidase family protein [Nocardioidaceae bacterium]